MQQFALGDRVRIDIPDVTDPDHQWHGEHGLIIDIIEDDAGLETGDARDSRIFRVGLEDQNVTIDARWRDLRPPFDGDS